MKQNDEWFSSEDVEEQIERHLSDQEQTSANAHLLQDLRHLSEDDVRRLADIRARLVAYETGKMERKPILLQPGQQIYTRPSDAGKSNRARRSFAARKARLAEEPGMERHRSAFLVRMISGLVAVLIIGNMLFAFAHLGTHSQQNTFHHPTATATMVVQDRHGISAFLMDATSGNVLVDVNSHVRRPITSMTAIMTAVVAIDNADLNQYITIEQATLNAVPDGMGTAGLHAGDRLQLQELLYGLFFSAGNDAALVIAQAVGGNTQRFVTMMNDEAHQLQLNDTHFSIPYSVPSLDNYSSAADLTRLGAYALQLSPVAQMVKEKEHSLAATALNHSYHWHMTNTLFAAYPGMNGILTGSDTQAGACMVFSAQKNDRILIGSELHAQTYKELGADVTKLLKQGFSS